MTPTIIITGLVAALFASLWANWLQAKHIAHWKARYDLLIKNLDRQQTSFAVMTKAIKPSQSNYDPDDYSDLTSAQKHSIGERS